MGNRKEADGMRVAATKRDVDLWASEIARVHALRSEKELALHWPDRACEQRDEDLWFVKGDPPLRSLAPEPRFQALLRKMNVPVDPAP